MYKDLRNDKTNPILYFRIVEHHKKLLGDDTPLNLWQLMDLVGTEIPFEEARNRIPDNCITFVRLCDLNVKEPFEPIEAEKENYPWEELAKSVSKHGIVVSVIAERLLKKNGMYTYRALEGKHRVPAVAMMKPFDLNRLLPCLIVEYDLEYTYICHISKKPHLRIAPKKEQ